MTYQKKPLNSYQRISLFSLRFSFTVLFLLTLLGIVFWRMGLITESAEKEYYKLMADAESSRSSSIHEKPYTARQERQNIQKDLFFNKDNKRLQIHLTAAKAQLVLDHKDAHAYLVEHMQQVKCLMQEELYYVLPDGQEALLQPNGQLLLRSSSEKDPASWLPANTPNLKLMQIIRFIEADEADYYYKDDRFVAQTVKITRYSIPGHQLHEINSQAKFLMKGTAESVEFSLKGKNKDLNFKAHHLKGAFYDVGGVHL